jgi:hypothetical protein
MQIAHAHSSKTFHVNYFDPMTFWISIQIILTDSDLSNNFYMDAI